MCCCGSLPRLQGNKDELEELIDVDEVEFVEGLVFMMVVSPVKPPITAAVIAVVDVTCSFSERDCMVINKDHHVIMDRSEITW